MLSLFLAPLIALGGIIPLIGEPPGMPEVGSTQIAFGRWGPTSIKYNGTEFLSDGWTYIDYAKFKDTSGNVSDGSNTSTTTTVDTDSGVVSQTYPWGIVKTKYETAGSRVNMTVSIRNDSSKTLASFMFIMPRLQFPQKPAEYDGNTPLLAHNAGEPTAVPMSYGSGTMVFANEDVTQPLIAGFPWALDRPTSTIFPLMVNTGRDGRYPPSLPFVDRPIVSGATLQFTLSLRFGPAGSTLATLANDVFQNFATAFPFKLQWSDRRPIGSLFLATSATGWPKNPRGWFGDSSIDVTTSSGVAALQSRLLAYADSSIAILKSMNAQGAITWDVEGEQYPHATTYIGDPRIAEKLAPELEGVLDRYFQKFRDAGLRVGVTLRPQQFAVTSGGASQNEVTDPAQQLIDKITYAKNRWGCTLFYIDSNGDPNDPIDAAFIERVAAAFPDVLLIPESQNTRYYSTTAPYDELRMGVTGTPASVQRIYPGAVTVLNIADGDLDGKHDAVLSAVRRGDILLFRAWFNDSANAKVKAIYDAAAQN